MSVEFDIDDENMTSQLKMKIGRHFRAFRKAIGKTQVQLARELKVHPSTIARIEKGKIFPGVLYLKYLNQRYMLNSNWLFYELEGMFLTFSMGNDGAAAGIGADPGKVPWYALDVEALGIAGRPVETRSLLEEVSRYHPIKRKHLDN